MDVPVEQRDGAGGPPFGLPVLRDVPELAIALELAGEADRVQARLVEAIVDLRSSRLAEHATGLALDRWLATIGRFTRSDRRMLLAAAEVVERLPLLRVSFVAGRLSWSQLRTVVCKVRRLPVSVDATLDVALADAVEATGDAEPDALARAVDWVVAAHSPEDESPQDRVGPPDEDRLVLQPRLDGSGGTVVGDLGPVGFAALDAATAPDRSDLTGVTGGDGGRLVGQPRDPAANGRMRARLGAARAARLTELCLQGGPAQARPPTRLVVRAELDTLIGGRLPAQLLTTLAGGRVDVDAATARRLLDDAGADTRLVIVDHGRVVGVGRRSRRGPGWLADVQVAVHDTCTEPGCLTAARVCDLDHAVPDEANGRTDVDNIGPLCSSANRGPDRRRWDVTQDTDGTRTWRHRATGLTTRTLPATWRPPDLRPGRHRPVMTSGGRRGYQVGPPDRSPPDGAGDHDPVPF